MLHGRSRSGVWSVMRRARLSQRVFWCKQTDENGDPRCVIGSFSASAKHFVPPLEILNSSRDIVIAHPSTARSPIDSAS